MDDDLQMAAAVKSNDGFFATFVVSRYSPHIVRWAAGQKFTANQVTAASVLLALAAATLFATGSRAGLVIGAVLVQLAFTADCVDGQLARYTATSSPVGAWLDAVSDRGKEFAIYAGLAIGGANGGDDGIWVLAVSALALQAVRHQLTFAYDAQHEVTPDGSRRHDGTVEGPTDVMARRVGVAGVRAADALERSWLKWVKRIVVLPIGERFALISVTAALAGPRTVFVALLAWGTVAMVYMTTGRLLRSLARARRAAGPKPAPDPALADIGGVNPLLASYRDDGPLALALQHAAPSHVPAVVGTLLGCAALLTGLAIDGVRMGSASMIAVGLFIVLGARFGARRSDASLRWIVPPLLHAGEYMTLIVLGWRAGMMPATFVLLVVLAYHHYDVVYRRGPAQLPRPTDLLAGGWDGRTLLLAVAAAGGIFPGVTVGLTAWTTVLFAAAGVRQVRVLTRDAHQLVR